MQCKNPDEKNRRHIWPTVNVYKMLEFYYLLYLGLAGGLLSLFCLRLCPI